MKRIIIVFAVLLAAVIGGLFFVRNRNTPEKTVVKMLDSLQAGRLSRAAKCTVDSTLNLEELGWSGKRFYKEIFHTIHYTIVSSEIEGETAKVSVVVTMVDMQSLMAEASQQSLDLTFSGSSYRNLITKRLRAGDVEYILNTVSVYLVKDQGHWKVDMEDSSKFASAITGGVGDLIGY